MDVPRLREEAEAALPSARGENAPFPGGVRQHPEETRSETRTRVRSQRLQVIFATFTGAKKAP